MTNLSPRDLEELRDRAMNDPEERRVRRTEPVDVRVEVEGFDIVVSLDPKTMKPLTWNVTAGAEEFLPSNNRVWDAIEEAYLES